MFVLRKHDFDDDSRFLLRKWLKLDRPNLKLVEMGSGSGYFTEQLLKMANKPSLICIEPDDMLLDYAKKRLGERAIFKKGFIEDPPLPADSADLVICYVLLCNVPDIRAAVKGMIRTTKPEGIVCAIEPVFLGGFSPDPREKLIVEGHSANIDGAWIKRRKLLHYPKEYPYDQYVYPRIFAECRLSRIEVHALSSCHYDGDWRLTTEDAIQTAREWLGLLEKHKKRYEANLKRSGWKTDKIEALFKAWREYHTETLKNPGKRDHSIYVKCNMVTVGHKQ